MTSGIYPQQSIRALIKSGAITGLAAPIEASGSAPDSAPSHIGAGLLRAQPSQIQPASLDLSLGETAYRLRASFLPGRGRRVSECLKDDIAMHEVKLTDGAVLETGCVYLAPLREGLNLPKNVSAAANPKSSTGRLDVFTRVLTDYAEGFDQIEAGYSGPLYVEIAPRTFSVLARSGDRLVQARFREGASNFLRSETVSIDLEGIAGSDIVGWRARRHAGLVDLAGRDHKARDFWEPIMRSDARRLILDPEEFYILASKESVQIPRGQAAEMAPVALEIGEFRAHYAGFFDPGFGIEAAGGQGSRAVLEVRGRDVPFILEHGQPVARLDFEPMLAPPDSLYGEGGSHYQAQGLRLSKHFAM